jgi:8-oxo-dGTP pyrophosphatase MutT (NUDIX family)
MKNLVQKVAVYCVKGDQLLVFRHLDYSAEEVGIQVPAGTVRAGEGLASAALRETEEETGLKGFVIEKLLGRAFYDVSPYRNEVQERFFFLASAPNLISERWYGGEDHDGTAPRTRFEFFWIPLKQGHVLQGGQGALLGMIDIHNSKR